ncbi:MAG: CDP-alcohol phosphatidyltransferase family protein [Parvibaculum sp.]
MTNHATNDANTMLPKIRAWAIHAFTASGLIPALLAIDALIKGDPKSSLLWLGLALLIDGLDGPLARRYEVTRHAPRFDGAILDLVIDYLTYTAIPALMIWYLNLVPEGFGLIAASYVMITALYCFGNRDMKTDDNYFSGFPATWNLVVLYFILLGSDPWVNVGIIAALGILTFIPLKFVHPLRVKRFRLLTIFMTATWSLSSLWLIINTTPAPMLDTEPAAFGAWLFSSFYFFGLSAYRTWENRSHDH